MILAFGSITNFYSIKLKFDWLVKVAKECMEVGIQQVRPWGVLGICTKSLAIAPAIWYNNYYVVSLYNGKNKRIGRRLEDDN